MTQPGAGERNSIGGQQDWAGTRSAVKAFGRANRDDDRAVGGILAIATSAEIAAVGAFGLRAGGAVAPCSAEAGQIFAGGVTFPGRDARNWDGVTHGGRRRHGGAGTAAEAVQGAVQKRVGRYPQVMRRHAALWVGFRAVPADFSRAPLVHSIFSSLRPPIAFSKTVPGCRV